MKPIREETASSPFMTSMNSISQGLRSLQLHGDDPKTESVHLLDDHENLLIKSEGDFLGRLKIPRDERVKVVSIFGNTGEGKSHTLNHAFFGGREVFKTSPHQMSCTIGVWAMYEPARRAICLDTEGFLGITKAEGRRTRLLLKILAVSDVIVYRTKAERLHRDMYAFLGGASKAYKEHFDAALSGVLRKYEVEGSTASGVGPGVIVFHETTNTDTLTSVPDVDRSPEDILRENFAASNESCDGFSSLKYVGFKTTRSAGSFDELGAAVDAELESNRVRSARNPRYVYLTLKGLNEKFQGHINDESSHLYLSAFFTCQDKCMSCDATCILSMGHKDEGVPHSSQKDCVLQHQWQNFVYLCKKCKRDGCTHVVEPRYQAQNEKFWSSLISTVWSGYVIECPKCGKIYQSREYWYGNKDPRDEAVEVKTVHVWPGQKNLIGSQNSAQKVIDGVTTISNAVASVGSQPTKMISDWVTDQIAPAYWTPNNEILECRKCKLNFESNATKHHCRACGEGFCEACSSKTKPVPSRGWTEDVRVCDGCFEKGEDDGDRLTDPAELRSRKIGESVMCSISAVKSILDRPKELIKETARPPYWTPDGECAGCCVCGRAFGPGLRLHHCRDCGRGVCDACSPERRPVPVRCWDTPVRVCNACLK